MEVKLNFKILFFLMGFIICVYGRIHELQITVSKKKILVAININSQKCV